MSIVKSAKSGKYSGMQFAALGFVLGLGGVLLAFGSDAIDDSVKSDYFHLAAHVMYLVAYSIVVVGIGIGFFGITMHWWSIVSRLVSSKQSSTPDTQP